MININLCFLIEINKYLKKLGVTRWREMRVGFIRSARLVPFEDVYCRVTNYGPNPKGVGYRPNKPNTINL